MATSSAIRVTLFGAGGRMGSEVMKALSTERDIHVVHAVEREDQADRTVEGIELEADGRRVGADSDVLVDVSLADAAHEHALRAGELGIPILIGATGFSDEQRADIEAIPVAHIVAPNLSRGVNVLFDLATRAASALKEFDSAIVDTHHRHKLDQPSGTAKKIHELLLTEGSKAQTVSVRVGEVVGEHRVVFAAEGETVELIHRASSRQALARGVAPAVRFLRGREPGRYSMADVLGLTG